MLVVFRDWSTYSKVLTMGTCCCLIISGCKICSNKKKKICSNIPYFILGIDLYLLFLSALLMVYQFYRIFSKRTSFLFYWFYWFFSIFSCFPFGWFLSLSVVLPFFFCFLWIYFILLLLVPWGKDLGYWFETFLHF